MPNIDSKQHILIAFVTTTTADLTIATSIVRQSIDDGASFIFPRIRRDEHPIRFWLLIAGVMVAALGFAAALAYAVFQ